MKTKERLAQALQEVGLRDMATMALGGYYDDFESPLATPITQLAIDLTAEARVAGQPMKGRLLRLAQRAKCGEFDATTEEGEAWFRREGRLVVDKL